jgi:hypothetical protein
MSKRRATTTRGVRRLKIRCRGCGVLHHVTVTEKRISVEGPADVFDDNELDELDEDDELDELDEEDD